MVLTPNIFSSSKFPFQKILKQIACHVFPQSLVLQLHQYTPFDCHVSAIRNIQISIKSIKVPKLIYDCFEYMA